MNRIPQESHIRHPETSPSAHPGRTEYYPLLAMLFVAVLLLSNIVAQKTITLGSFVFPGAILLFPIAYIFGDVLTEVYGYGRARLVIWGGLIANLLMVITFQTVIALPGSEGWELQEEFATILGVVPRVVLASMIGYWSGEFSNAYVLARLKILTKGRHLWMRTIGSTLVGEGVDTTLFIVIAFWGILPESILFRAILSSYVFKVGYEIVATPLTYLIVGFLKKKEGLDVYDTHTDFSPFRLRIGSGKP